ncbi:MAG: LutC/YkgG family protein [Bdellovibrio bacteriovorus]
MSSPRARILARLGQVALEPDWLAPEIPIPRFDWGPQRRLERFQEQLDAVRGEMHRVGDNWASRALGLLRERGASRLLFGPDAELAAGLEAAWREAGGESSGLRLIPYGEPVERLRDTLFDAVDAGITGCRGAIAETGTVVLWPDVREPRLLSLVPPVHLVLLEAGSIRSTFAELLDEQGWSQGMPSNALLITGPSKSADIEQTLAYGVHGPKELIVLIRGDGEGSG